MWKIRELEKQMDDAYREPKENVTQQFKVKLQTLRTKIFSSHSESSTFV